MKCVICNKEFKTPLELYNNELKCPHCMKNVIPETFSVSDESEEYFRLSEAAYYSYLELVSEDVKKRVSGTEKHSKSEVNAFNKEISGRLKIATNFCRRASYMGHPEAIVKLGYYYDNNLIDYGGSNTERDKIAKEYYSRVLCDFSSKNVRESSAEKYDQLIAVWNKNSDGNRDRTDQKVLEQDEDKIKEKVRALRFRAASYLLNMLANISQELRQREEYNFDKIRGMLIDCNIISDDDFKKGAMTFASFDRAEKVKSLLLNLGKQKTRTPVFGYYYLTKDELERLVEWIFEQNGMIKSNISVMPITFNNNGGVWARKSHTICNEGAMIQSYNDIKENENCNMLYFLNRNAGGIYARRNIIEAAKKLYDNFNGVESKGDVQNVMREWLAGEFPGAQSNGNFSESNCVDAAVGHVFYADDFYFLVKSKENQIGGHALENFVKFMK